MNGQQLFLQIIKSSLIILCIVTLHAAILWLVLPQNLPVKTQLLPPKPITVNLITPIPQPSQISPPKAMIASHSSPALSSSKMTTTTTPAIKNKKPQPSLPPINQPNKTKVQPKLKPPAQIEPVKKPISKSVKASIIKQPQPHKTMIRQAKKAEKPLKKTSHAKTAKPHLQPKKQKSQQPQRSKKPPQKQKPAKYSSKMVKPLIKSSNHSIKKNQQTHIQKNNLSKPKIKKIKPTQATTKLANSKIASQPLSPHPTNHQKNKNAKITPKNRVQRKLTHYERLPKDRITTRHQKTKGGEKGGKKSEKGKRFSQATQPQINNNKHNQGKFPAKNFANGGNGKNNGVQKKISQLEENHLPKYTKQKLVSQHQPTAPKTPSSPALFLSGKPPYPMISKRLGETGKVRLNVKVNAQGKAIQVKLKRSSGYRRLDQAAIRHIKQGIFQPALENGHPVTAWQEIRLVFKLQ